MTISRANVEDAAAILALQRLAYQSEARIYDNPDIPPLKQTLEELQSELICKVCLKAQIEDLIIGSVRGFLREETAFIERLIVHPNFQRQGLATELMRHVETHFAQAQRFELFTGHKSEGNLRLYHRLGYEIFKSEEIYRDLTFVYLEKRNG